MSTFESHIAAAPKGTDTHTEQASSHLRQDASSAPGHVPPPADTAHNTAAPHLPSVQLHDSAQSDKGIVASIGDVASQFLQGASQEVKDNPKNVAHSGELGLAAGVVTGVAIGGAAALGVLAIPEVAVVAGAAIAGGVAVAAITDAVAPMHSSSTEKGSTGFKHAGAVAADVAAAVTGGAVGAGAGAYGAMAAGEIAFQGMLGGL